MEKLLRMGALSLLVALGLGIVVACGGGDDDGGGASGAEVPGAQGNGSSDGGVGSVWKGEFETGTDVSLELWVDPSHPDLQDFEAFREAAGASPVLYGRVTAKNDGYVEDTARYVTLTGPDGDPFGASAEELQFLCSHIAMWIAAATTPSSDLLNQYNTLLADRCNGNTIMGPVIPPGETITYYVAYKGETEPEFERVFMGLGNELKR